MNGISTVLTLALPEVKQLQTAEGHRTERKILICKPVSRGIDSK